MYRFHCKHDPSSGFKAQRRAHAAAKQFPIPTVLIHESVVQALEHWLQFFTRWTPTEGFDLSRALEHLHDKSQQSRSKHLRFSDASRHCSKTADK